MTFQDLVAVLHRVVKTNESGQHLAVVFTLGMGDLGDFGFLCILQNEFPELDTNFRSLARPEHLTDILMMGEDHISVIEKQVPTNVQFILFVMFLLADTFKRRREYPGL
jgi:hypothetical protein